MFDFYFCVYVVFEDVAMIANMTGESVSSEYIYFTPSF